MIEAAMIWNEPNNKSHWDPEIDPGWSLFAETAIAAGQAIRAAKAIEAVSPDVTRVLGGISPIDPHFIERLKGQGVLDHVDVVAVHGFPLDWNLWPLHEWPQRIAEIEAVAPDHEIWATEVGVGSFGAEEVQVFGVDRTACRAFSGTACSTCPRPGPRRRATARRRARATTAISTWASSARTARPS